LRIPDSQAGCMISLIQDLELILQVKTYKVGVEASRIDGICCSSRVTTKSVAFVTTVVYQQNRWHLLQQSCNSFQDWRIAVTASKIGT
jgi:hypothetical protein